MVIGGNKMETRVIEGTWEEIERRKAELIGHQLRVIVDPTTDALFAMTPTAPLESTGPKKKLVGMGAFSGKTGGSEAFAQQKQAEIEREDARV
jgi:hypothetical protein